MRSGGVRIRKTAGQRCRVIFIYFGRIHAHLHIARWILGATGVRSDNDFDNDGIGWCGQVSLVCRRASCSDGRRKRERIEIIKITVEASHDRFVCVQAEYRSAATIAAGFVSDDDSSVSIDIHTKRVLKWVSVNDGFENRRVYSRVISGQAKDRRRGTPITVILT